MFLNITGLESPVYSSGNFLAHWQEMLPEQHINVQMDLLETVSIIFINSEVLQSLVQFNN